MKCYDRPTLLHRVPEDEWFRMHQPLLLSMLATEEGRKLLCVEVPEKAKGCPIVRFAKNEVRWARPDGSVVRVVSDFRTGSKWGNVIRYRWDAFQKLSKRFYTHGALTLVLVGGEARLAATTSTFYPDPNPESTSVDGEVLQDYVLGSGETWATIIAAAGSLADDSAVGIPAVAIRSDNVSNRWRQLNRGIFLFDTSAIDDTATIDSATFSLYGTGKSDPLAITPDINVYSSAPASNTALVGGDYDSIGTTAFSTAISYASWSTAAYNDFALNASGLAAISKTGVTKLGVRNANYDVAGVAPSWSSDQLSRIDCASADNAGTTTDPKLVVEWTVAIEESVTESATLSSAFTSVLTAVNSASEEATFSATFDAVKTRTVPLAFSFTEPRSMDELMPRLREWASALNQLLVPHVDVGGKAAVGTDTFANTSAEGTLYYTTMQARSLTRGKIVRLNLRGRYSTANASDTFTLRFKIAGATVLSITSTAASVTNAPVDAEFGFTVRDVGSSGSVFAFLTGQVNSVNKAATSTATTAIDTTEVKALSVTLQWSNALSGNSFSLDQAWVETVGV